MARAPGTAAASSANDSGTQVSSRREDRPSVIQRGAGAKDSLLDRVVELYSVAIEESDLPDSRLAAAYSKRGIAYGNQGRYALAIEDLSQSLQMQPNSAEVYFQRGRMYEAKGDEQRAAGDFEKAHLLDPENPDYRAKMEELARSGAVKPVDSGGCTSSSTRLC
jgi:tetratricopeptide (TPR) repeat protein